MVADKETRSSRETKVKTGVQGGRKRVWNDHWPVSRPITPGCLGWQPGTCAPLPAGRGTCVWALACNAWNPGNSRPG